MCFLCGLSGVLGHQQNETDKIMPTIWITYAWEDNKEQDVDFVAQELRSGGIEVKLDRWNISAGRRLWEQIENFICKPVQSDAWLLIATNNSLESEPCKEEFAYALQRSLDSRGSGYPVIALFMGPVDETLIPAGIKTRLFVSITDPDWKERIIAAAEGRSPHIAPGTVTAYVLKVHHMAGFKDYAIELRPRAGVWAPFFAAIPISEKDAVNPNIMIGPRDLPTGGGMLINTGAGPSNDGNWWIMFAGNQANPTNSYYVWCSSLPTQIAFGVNGRQPQYLVNLSQTSV